MDTSPWTFKCFTHMIHLTYQDLPDQDPSIVQKTGESFLMHIQVLIVLVLIIPYLNHTLRYLQTRTPGTLCQPYTFALESYHQFLMTTDTLPETAEYLTRSLHCMLLPIWRNLVCCYDPSFCLWYWSDHIHLYRLDLKKKIVLKYRFLEGTITNLSASADEKSEIRIQRSKRKTKKCCWSIRLNLLRYWRMYRVDRKPSSKLNF